MLIVVLLVVGVCTDYIFRYLSKRNAIRTKYLKKLNNINSPMFLGILPYLTLLSVVLVTFKATARDIMPSVSGRVGF